MVKMMAASFSANRWNMEGSTALQTHVQYDPRYAPKPMHNIYIYVCVCPQTHAQYN